MTSEMKLWLMVASTCLCMAFNVNAESQAPCFFIFGDSLADNGNNNALPTLAQVDYKPYGIDFKDGSTGRFTNGRTAVDILGELMGFDDYIPSFASAESNNIINGVNYASGSAGVLKKTGRHLGENVFFGDQLKHHRTVVWRLIDQLGSKAKANEHLNKCLYWVGLGSNDYLNNYFTPEHYNSSKDYTPEQYATLLIDQYRYRIEKLYKQGARKVALSGVGRIGCAPDSINRHGTNGSDCVETMNDAVRFFNIKLLQLVDQLNTNLTDAKFIYINSFGMGGGDPAAAGFKVWDKGCCPVNKLGQCDPKGTPCENRIDYVFWDSFHPTEHLNTITASRIYSAYDLSDSYPMDVNQLVQWSPHHD